MYVLYNMFVYTSMYWSVQCTQLTEYVIVQLKYQHPIINRVCNCTSQKSTSNHSV